MYGAAELEAWGVREAWSDVMATRLVEPPAGSAQNADLRKRAAGVLILMLAVGVTACSRDDTYLPALLADPMANYEAEGLELADSWEYAERPSVVGSPPGHAELERSYRIADSVNIEEVVAEAVAYAESVGWEVGRDSIASRLYVGTKDLEPGPGRLGISFGPDVDSYPDGEWHLRIHLDFDPVQSDETTIPGEGE